MSAPQSNPPDREQPSGHIPSVISVPTTPGGAMQTMLSMLSSHVGSQGAQPSTRQISIPTSAQEIAQMADAFVHASAASPTSAHAHAHAPPAGPPPSAHALATQIASDGVTFPPAAASTSSDGGRPHSPPRVPPRVTRSSSALPELGYIHPRPIPIPGGEAYRRSTAHYAESETFGPTNTKDDQEKSKFQPGTVGFRLDPTVKYAKAECAKAERTAMITSFALHIATGLQILIGALTTALGAALSGKNTSVAISTLGGASTLVASYLARSRSTNEPQASREKADRLNHFLREVEAFQLDHGSDTGDKLDDKGNKLDDKIKGFRLGLEGMLGNHTGSVAIHPGQAGPPGTGSGEKGMGAADSNTGMFASSSPRAKLDYPV